MNDYYRHQKETGEAILSLILRSGDTRTSFCRKAGISRPTLNKLINGEFTDEIRYDRYLQKIRDIYGFLPKLRKSADTFHGMYLNPGNQGFTEIRRGIYIDKTDLISLMNQRIGTKDKLVCVSRPRRFGKSYAAQMLCAYYDRSCDSSVLFRDMKIEKTEGYLKWLNALNVISLDITGFISSVRASGMSVSYVVRNIQDALKKELLEAYPDASGESTGALLSSVSRLYGDRFFFVIDEWDALFRDAATDYQVQDEYMNFLREIFKNGNVTADAIAGAYMTGILPIKKDGSESAISDFSEYTMLRPGPFFQYFGFTENEVEKLCHEEDVSFTEAQDWYDGYHDRSGESIYNPYSIIMACRYGQFDSYWRQSSASDILSDYIGMDFDGLSGCVASLLGGISVTVDTFSFNNDLTSLKNKDDVLTLLIHLGYLVYEWNDSTVHIPNEELRLEFARSVKEVKNTETLQRIRESEKLIMDTAAGKEEAVAAAIEKVHRTETTPLFYNNEQALRSVIKLAYFSYRDYYISMEELPSGDGYADIAYLPRRGSSLPALVVELKWNYDADTAISQIRRKHYPEVLLQYTSDILLVGISYNKNDPEKKHSCRIERV